MAVEDCGLYRKAKQGGFGFLNDPADPGMKYLRAIDIETGAVKWEIPQEGPVERNYSGVLATAGGLVFYGESSGGFAGRGREDWEHALACERKQRLEGFAHDVPGQRPSVCVDRGGI